MSELTQRKLKDILDYYPETGIFRWKIVKANNIHIGDIAGTIRTDGYIAIKIDYKLYKAHRLALLYMTSHFPTDQVDHRNHIREDNRFVNLRETTNKENGKNHKMKCNNTSGITGVDWHRNVKKWRARIMVDDKDIHLGHFININDAAAARKVAESKYGFHSNHGI